VNLRVTKITPYLCEAARKAGLLAILALATAPPVWAQSVGQSINAPGSPGSDPAGAALVRVTSSFEVIHASAVLKQVSKLFSGGFVRKDAEQVAKLIDSLAAEQSRSWEFNVMRKGVSYPLRVRARIDEFGMLDLDFFTVPAVVGSVRGAVDGYLNARGL
jgi:hypothetical protein